MKVVKQKLGSVAQITAGQSPPSSSYNKTGDGVPFFQGMADFNGRHPKIRFWCTEPTKIALPDDILISVRAPVGPVIINNVKACIGRGLAGIRANKNVSKDYLYYALKGHEQKIASLGVGSTFKAITQKTLREFELPIPDSYEDQCAIAEILSKAEALIAKRKESIALLDEYLKSTFLEMFGDPVRNEKGWETKSGGEYFEKLTVGVVIKPASYYVSKGVIALRSLNIRPNRIDLKNLVYFSEEVNSGPLAKSKLSTGDVVFVRTGSTGTAAIIPKELDGVNCIDLIVTRPKKHLVDPLYLVFFFNSDFGKRVVNSKEVGGIQKHFNIGAIRNLKIPIPPLQLQTKFALVATKIEKMKMNYTNGLEELEQLYGVLSQKAFSNS